MRLRCIHYKTKPKEDMNTRTIEPAGALPSYDVHDRVVHTPLGTTREIVCTVSGYEDADGELAYRLLGDDQLQYKSTFRCLAPYIEDDLDDPDYFERHDYGEQDLDFDLDIFRRDSAAVFNV